MTNIKLALFFYFIFVAFSQIDGSSQSIVVESKDLKTCRKLCIKGYQCLNGKCVPKKDQMIRCKKGFKLVKGKCIKITTDQSNQINICPSTSIKPIQCTIRPIEKECPTVFYIRQPDPVACGVKVDGTRVSFSEECSACKDQSIVYYFNIPCHKSPITCLKSQQCLGYYCSNQGCQKNGDCPYDWQVCDQGKCADSCILKDCLGNCKYGQCNYIQPNGECFLNDESKCQNGWKCIVSQCGDRCWNTRCPPNQNCNKDSGSCQPEIVY